MSVRNDSGVVSTNAEINWRSSSPFFAERLSACAFCRRIHSTLGPSLVEGANVEDATPSLRERGRRTRPSHAAREKESGWRVRARRRAVGMCVHRAGAHHASDTGPHARPRQASLGPHRSHAQRRRPGHPRARQLGGGAGGGGEAEDQAGHVGVAGPHAGPTCAPHDHRPAPRRARPLQSGDAPHVEDHLLWLLSDRPRPDVPVAGRAGAEARRHRGEGAEARGWGAESWALKGRCVGERGPSARLASGRSSPPLLRLGLS
mmetsp:Transcript_40910/g.96170  ORF Transcript_40910/g.96170 Transcript_40910/m.96170 type:complete len:261 (+) Transcript_40910:1050-1832(+)